MTPPRQPRFQASIRLNLLGTEAPTTEVAIREEDDQVTLLFRANDINQFVAFTGTAQEVRQALTKGLAEVDRVIAERAWHARGATATEIHPRRPDETGA